MLTLSLGACKLLCTREGILVDNVIVNKSLLAVWFERLTDVDWSENSIFSLLNPNPDALSQRIHSLLSPKDAQDVPRAIKLLSITADLRNLDTSAFNPSERKTHRALSLLGEMFDALLFPFVSPDSSLSQQITSLAKFAFIACALFLGSEADFMPHHLYGDLQCMVKTAIMRVAHMKNLDPERQVFLCLLGDDVLEVLFGRSRMIGGHSPNVDPGELRNRFGAAFRLDSIFQKYPEWEKRSRRLKLKRNRDTDHLSPRHWTGELRASSCDLEACWKGGMSQAETVLAKFGKPFQFNVLFADWQKTGVDLMRPKGGKYPGISKEIDRSLAVDTDSTPEDIDENYRDFLAFDGKAVYEAERKAAEQRVDEEHSIWMELDGGKPAHKKTILRIFMDPTLDVDYNKSHDRLLRVRYFSIGGRGWDQSASRRAPAIPNANTFVLGSLYATLICVDQKKICVGILQCTSLKSASQYLDQAPADELALPDSTYEVSGQILSLVPMLFEEDTRTQGQSSISWAWDSQFVALNTAKSRQPSASSSTLVSSTSSRVHHLSITKNVDFSDGPQKS